MITLAIVALTAVKKTVQIAYKLLSVNWYLTAAIGLAYTGIQYL